MPSALKRRIERAVPPSVRVETAKENADRGRKKSATTSASCQTILLVFGFVAVFVGAFLIFNTFSITVAQRVTEFGLLRTLGASRRQILSSVLIEAVAIGLLGALVGIAGGYVMAILLNALLGRSGSTCRRPALVMESRTVVVSLLVGVVVTSVSSMVPALRSTRVPPIAALHAYTPPASRGRRLLYVASRAARPRRPGDPPDRPLRQRRRRHSRRDDGRRSGRDRARRLALQPPPGAAAGGGRRLAAGADPPPVGRLARENAQRNPSRTAITAAALMIGLALVTFVTVFAAGLKSSVAQVVDENFEGGLVIQNSDGFSPIPTGTAAAARKVPGVKTVATIRSTEAELVGSGPTYESPRPPPMSRGGRRWNGRRAGPATLRRLA